MTDPEGAPQPIEFNEGELDAPVRNRRGRPRSQDTLTRDERVLEALQAGPKSREQLAAELGESSSLVYLALWRLAHANKVEKTVNGTARHAWQLTG
jgi:hypothetical protein